MKQHARYLVGRKCMKDSSEQGASSTSDHNRRVQCSQSANTTLAPTPLSSFTYPRSHLTPSRRYVSCDGHTLQPRHRVAVAAIYVVCAVCLNTVTAQITCTPRASLRRCTSTRRCTCLPPIPDEGRRHDVASSSSASSSSASSSFKTAQVAHGPHATSIRCQAHSQKSPVMSLIPCIRLMSIMQYASISVTR